MRTSKAFSRVTRLNVLFPKTFSEWSCSEAQSRLKSLASLKVMDDEINATTSLAAKDAERLHKKIADMTSRLQDPDFPQGKFEGLQMEVIDSIGSEVSRERILSAHLDLEPPKDGSGQIY
jgi:hypothetical protein